MSVLCFKESSGLLAHGLKTVSSFWVYLLVILEEFRKRIWLSLWCQLYWSLWEVINQHLRRMTSDEEDGLTTHVRCVIAVSSVICGRTCPVWSQYYCQSSEVCSCKCLYQKSYNVNHISAALWQSDTESLRFSDATTPNFISYEPFPEVSVFLVLTTKRHWGKTQVYDSYTFCQAR